MAVFKLYHKDMGRKGSEFIVSHPSIKSKTVFGILLSLTLLASFSMGLHLLDKNILASTTLVLFSSLVVRMYLKITTEKVLFLPSLGVQVETTYFLGHTVTYFIDISHIKDIVINEAITMHSVMYYLVVLRKEEQSDNIQQLYPLFSHSWPRLTDLKQVYRAAQEKLIIPRDL
ncbi:phosphatidylinositol N-acetylglucosaminyltransferase subunit H [Aplysia californica]|uniref:Phosphatidylinositol N-acetylglucosaminyltransferase subunit H n=1 Tax=Aplysia californica TaxID=6500 RepID=A0ABM0JIH4_APLCA|nr:phosphatidylinositol N-acetylglucosaminyltransferase subunit H [Aplysia californica]